MRFVKESPIEASAAEVFAFHEQPGTFERLQPPWQKTELIQPPTSLAAGTEVIVKIKVGPLWQRVVAVHERCEPGVMFADRMVEGPFSSWYHEHWFMPTGERSCILRDQIDFELPLGAFGRLLGGRLARRQLARLFDYRHRVTREALARHRPAR